MKIITLSIGSKVSMTININKQPRKDNPKMDFQNAIANRNENNIVQDTKHEMYRHTIQD